MKKIVAGFLAGALFTLGTTSFAAEIKSLVGKKIQSEVTVTANGKQLDNAVVVDGKSYAPVRAIAQAAGMEVEFGKEGIVLTETAQEPVTNPVNEAAPEEPAKEQQAVNWEDDAKIKEWQAEINRLQEKKNEAAESLSSGQLTNFEAEGAQGVVEDLQQIIDRYEKRIDERKAKLAEENK